MLFAAVQHPAGRGRVHRCRFSSRHEASRRVGSHPPPDPVLPGGSVADLGPFRGADRHWLFSRIAGGAEGDETLRRMIGVVLIVAVVVTLFR